MSKKKKKIRAQFRKNRNARTRRSDWTRQFDNHGFKEEDPLQQERISGKGELTRKRTVTGVEVDDGDEPGLGVHLEVDEDICLSARVLRLPASEPAPVSVRQ
jgi:ribosome biogenesis GTPase